jgi:hypothetical protein
VVVDGVSAVIDLWLCRGKPYEYGDRHCSVCQPLSRTGVATKVPWVGGDLSRHHGDDRRRTSRQSNGLGGHERSMQWQAFDITNGDFDRWENLWPRIAHFFKLEYAPPQRLPLTIFMSDKEPLWDNLVKKYNLLNYTFGQAAAWPFADAVFNLAMT